MFHLCWFFEFDYRFNNCTHLEHWLQTGICHSRITAHESRNLYFSTFLTTPREIIHNFAKKIFMELLSNSYVALFLIIALGYIIGNIKIGGISLDISAIIFVALIFGHFGVVIPKDFQYIGLVLFIFTIGIQAGPGFFSSFATKGKKLNILATILILSGTLTTYGIIKIFHIDKDIALGLFTGALTSTPGLAVATETANSPIASIGYGIAYPFGVLGVILFVKLLPGILRIDLKKEEQKLEKQLKENYPEIHFEHFVVSNENVIEKTLFELKIRSMTGASVSRVKHNGKCFTPNPKTVLYNGDIIRAVGSTEALKKVEMLFGHKTEEIIGLGDAFEIKSILVTNKEIINKTLQQLNLFQSFNAVVTRVRRSGIDIAPDPDLHLQVGDKLLISCNKNDMKQLSNLLGNDDKDLSDTNIFPIAAGIIIGVLIGKIALSFNNFSFSLGLTGGVLVTALLLGKIAKTGPIVWTMSGNSNMLLRQLGLVMFMAAVGSSAGAKLVETYNQYGIQLFLYGAVITLLPMFITAFVSFKLLKVNIFTLLGTLTGGMTSTPGLAAIDSMSDSSEASLAYATVYPVAMVLLIICVQLLSVL